MDSPKQREWFLVSNTSGEAVPSQGIMQYTTATRAPNLRTGVKPAYSSIIRFGILKDDIPDAKTGVLFVAGTHYVTVTLQPGESLMAGDRVRPQKASWYTRKFSLGPMLVEAVIGASSNGGAADITTTALVTITKRRGDNKMADCPSTAQDGPYEAYVYDSTYTLTAGTNPGDVNVDLA